MYCLNFFEKNKTKKSCVCVDIFMLNKIDDNNMSMFCPPPSFRRSVVAFTIIHQLARINVASYSR